MVNRGLIGVLESDIQYINKQIADENRETDEWKKLFEDVRDADELHQYSGALQNAWGEFKQSQEIELKTLEWLKGIMDKVAHQQKFEKGNWEEGDTGRGMPPPKF